MCTVLGVASETFTYVSETRAKGMAAGEAKIILRILKRRGIPVDDHSRRRIESCTDQDTLEKWADRTVDVETVGQLFED